MVPSITFVLLSLIQDAIVAQLEFLDVVVETIQPILCSLSLIVLLLKLRNQLSIVILSLMKGLVKASIHRFTISHLLF